jgi:hypothetical protein
MLPRIRSFLAVPLLVVALLLGPSLALPGRAAAQERTLDPIVLLQDLETSVIGLELRPGLQFSLLTKVQGARRALDRDNARAAVV